VSTLVEIKNEQEQQRTAKINRKKTSAHVVLKSVVPWTGQVENTSQTVDKR